MRNVLEEIAKVAQLFNEIQFLQPYSVYLEELKEKLEKGWLNIVFVGEFNSGKTSLINSLFKVNLPISILPETASIWKIQVSRAEKPQISIKMADGSSKVVSSFEDVKTYNPKDIKYVDVYLPATLDEGIIVVDTPGLSSLDVYHNDVLLNFIEESDVLFIVIDVNQGLTKTLAKFIDSGLKERRKTFGILTKAETKPETSSQELKKYLLSNFQHLIEDVVITSSKTDRIKEVEDLLSRISKDKGSIISQSAQRKLKEVCSLASELVDNQIENASLDLSELEAKRRTINEELDNLDKELKALMKRIENEVDELTQRASRTFIRYLESKVDWILEAVYDDDLEENVQDRFAKAIKEAARHALMSVKEDVEDLFERVKKNIENLQEKFNVGKSFSIRAAELLVKLREVILDLLLLGKFLDRLGRLGSAIRGVVGTLITYAIKLGTKDFIRSKIKDAINSDLNRAFKNSIEEQLFHLIRNAYSEISEEIKRKRESFSLAYEELKREKEKKVTEFQDYIDYLQNLKIKILECGGDS